MAPSDVPRGMPDEYMKKLAEERADAEDAGVFDDDIFDCIESPGSQLHLTAEQEMALYQAASSLSELAKETNSTVSELLRLSAYN